MASDVILIALAALLVSLSCSLVGTHLLLRRQAMFGDVLSHSVLPGLVAAYIVFGSLSGWTLFVGALVAGVLSSFLIEFLRNFSKKIREDAAMGIVFTSMFALGLVMINFFAEKAHLDVDCVLFGELLFVPLDEAAQFLGLSVPRSIVYLFAAFALLFLVEKLFHKELVLCAFHPGMANCLGIPSRFYHYLVMVMASLAIVASFEIVGAIMVIAFLVIPPALGRLLSSHFWGIYFYAISSSVFAIALGLFLAFSYNLNAAASIVVAEFLFFSILFLVKFFAKKYKVSKVATA